MICVIFVVDIMEQNYIYIMCLMMTPIFLVKLCFRIGIALVFILKAAINLIKNYNNHKLNFNHKQKYNACGNLYNIIE